MCKIDYLNTMFLFSLEKGYAHRKFLKSELLRRPLKLVTPACIRTKEIASFFSLTNERYIMNPILTFRHVKYCMLPYPFYDIIVSAALLLNRNTPSNHVLSWCCLIKLSQTISIIDSRDHSGRKCRPFHRVLMTFLSVKFAHDFEETVGSMSEKLIV